MRSSISTCTLLLLSLTMVAIAQKAQPADERSAALTVAYNYMDAYYTADVARMEHALHPSFHKRTLRALNGQVDVQETSALSMLEGVRSGTGPRVPINERVQRIQLLDLYENVANVKIVTGRWIDYMLLSKSTGEWRVLEVVLQYTSR